MGKKLIPLKELKKPRTGDSLEKIVQDYTDNMERLWCSAKLNDFDTIIDCICGKIQDRTKLLPPYARCRHQANLHNETIKQAAEVLEKLTTKLEQCSDFDELLNTVNSLNIWGFGPLAKYDFCVRFGYKRALQPTKYVYLHAGTREGAFNLMRLIPKLNKKEYADKIPTEELPKCLQTIEPIHIENLFCIFKDRLANLKKINNC